MSTGECSFEVGSIRPPSKGGSSSLLIRPTRNCPWNKCKFCNAYKGKGFAFTLTVGSFLGFIWNEALYEERVFTK